MKRPLFSLLIPLAIAAHTDARAQSPRPLGIPMAGNPQPSARIAAIATAFAHAAASPLLTDVKEQPLTYGFRDSEPAKSRLSRR